jgi:hypothetical protein
MATPDQQQELLDALKFTPREIEISLLGYGGEIVMGEITAEQYNFWKGRADFDDYLWDWDYELPADADPAVSFISTGSWHECDNITHECSVEMSASCVMRVQDLLEDREIFETNLDVINLQQKHGMEVEWRSSVEREDFPDKYLFVGQSIEKGSFGSHRLRITRPFDPSLLKIYVYEVDGWCLFGGLEYDGDEGEDQGDYDTTGKGSEFMIHYQPPLDRELSEWHDAGSTHPAHDGVYDVDTDRDDSEVERRAWWINGAWREQDGTEIENVRAWRGLSGPAE